MPYVGLDVHRRRTQVAALDEDGHELFNRNVPNDPERLLRQVVAQILDLAARLKGQTIEVLLAKSDPEVAVEHLLGREG